jgi:hypothetical protein
MQSGKQNYFKFYTATDVPGCMKGNSKKRRNFAIQFKSEDYNVCLTIKAKEEQNPKYFTIVIRVMA